MYGEGMCLNRNVNDEANINPEVFEALARLLRVVERESEEGRRA